jgi:hypothetical protein
LPIALLPTLIACGKKTQEEAASRSIPNVLLFSDAEKSNSGHLSDDDLTAAGKALSGGWYTFNDVLDCPKSEHPRSGMINPAMGQTYTLTPYEGSMVTPPPEGDNNKAAIRFWGGGHVKWGAGIGIPFNNPSGVPLKYDLTVTKAIGFRFWARTAVGDVAVKVKLQDKWSEGQADPLYCCYLDKAECGPNICGEEEKQGCYDTAHKVVTVTPAWQKFEVLFTDMARLDMFGTWQDGMDHKMEPPALNEAYQLQLEVGTLDTFDVWIDNVGFMLSADPVAAAK